MFGFNIIVDFVRKVGYDTAQIMKNYDSDPHLRFRPVPPPQSFIDGELGRRTVQVDKKGSTLQVISIRGDLVSPRPPFDIGATVVPSNTLLARGGSEIETVVLINEGEEPFASARRYAVANGGMVRRGEAVLVPTTRRLKDKGVNYLVFTATLEDEEPKVRDVALSVSNAMKEAERVTDTLAIPVIGTGKRIMGSGPKMNFSTQESITAINKGVEIYRQRRITQQEGDIHDEGSGQDRLKALYVVVFPKDIEAVLEVQKNLPGNLPPLHS